MKTCTLSDKKIKSLSLVLFLVGLAIIAYFDFWWPGIMLIVGLPIAIRQYLLGRYYDAFVSVIVFGGVFIFVQFQIHGKMALPILFIVGALYIFFRDWFRQKEETLAKKENEETKK